jgi:hypothetical protein
MFAITTKVKIAAGVAAGVLTLGAAGAYAANANSTVTPQGGAVTLTNSTGTTLNLVGISKGDTSLQLPSTPFSSPGQCVSWFATNRNWANAPAAGTTTLSKNYHGKLMSSVQSFCSAYKPAKGTSDSAETETPDAAQSDAPSTDSTNLSGSTHGHGHGHGKHARETD